MDSSLHKTLLQRLINLSKINSKFIRFKNDNVDFQPDFIISPVQARLVDFGMINSGEIISKNKKKIKLSDLIGEYWTWFSNGFFLNFYLSPKDKHYWRTPYEGEFVYTQFNKGKAKIPVFIGLERFFKNHDFFEKAIKQNATIGSIFQTHAFPIAMIAVGSLGVNNIKIFHQENQFYKRGEICGCFKIGSSMILCFPDINQFEMLIKKQDKVDIGEPILRVKY